MEVKNCIYFLVVITFYCVSAVPEYFVEEHCSQTLALNYGNAESVRLRLTKSDKYLDGMRCAMRIQAPEGKRLVIRIENFDVHGNQEALCQGGDYLQFFDGPSESSIIHPDLPATICQKPSMNYILTSGRFLVMRFVSNTDLNAGSGMKLVITAFSDAPCSEDEFQCKSTSHCIQRSLQCDQQPSCPDATDESMPECLSTAAIAGISVACVVVVAAVVISIVVVCIVRERRKRARIIKRAMEHEEKHQTYPGSLWIQSRHSGLLPPEDGRIDLSKIDPIWDGHENSSNMDPIWGGNLASENMLQKWDLVHKDTTKMDPIWTSRLSLLENLDNDNKINPGYDFCRIDSKTFDGNESNLKVTNDTAPTESQMKKVPSGFWEIDLSGLGMDLSMNSTRSMTVL